MPFMPWNWKTRVEGLSSLLEGQMRVEQDAATRTLRSRASHGFPSPVRHGVLIDKMRLNPRNAAVVATALFLTGIVVLVFACASLRLSGEDVTLFIEQVFADGKAEPAELARAFVVERKSEARFIRALIIWPSACFMGSAALLFLARQENLRGKRDQNISVEATDAGAS
jgi:hypothetical protein